MYTNKECPCKYEPVVMPVRECVCNRYYCVEQPIICPVQKRIVNHYVPKPVYYHTYSQCEENICEPPLQGCGCTQQEYKHGTNMGQNPYPFKR